MTHSAMRDDIRRLGRQLGDAIARQEGPSVLDLVEQVRVLARDVRIGDPEDTSTPDAATALDALLAEVDTTTAILLVRAFTLYFHLANVTEQAHRIEHLNVRTADAGRITDTVQRLVADGHAIDEVARAVGDLELRPVFTAHPTEASRRSILDKLTEVGELLEMRSGAGLQPAQRRRIDRRIDELIDGMWQTDEIRRDKPAPTDEARTVLYYVEMVARTALPRLVDDVAITLRDNGCPVPTPLAPVRFGNWVGGDRDGNPFVTPAVTTEVLDLQRGRAIRLLEDEVDALLVELPFDHRDDVFDEPAEFANRADHRYGFRSQAADRAVGFELDQPVSRVSDVEVLRGPHPDRRHVGKNQVGQRGLPVNERVSQIICLRHGLVTAKLDARAGEDPDRGFGDRFSKRCQSRRIKVRLLGVGPGGHELSHELHIAKRHGAFFPLEPMLLSSHWLCQKNSESLRALVTRRLIA